MSQDETTCTPNAEPVSAPYVLKEERKSDCPHIWFSYEINRDDIHYGTGRYCLGCRRIEIIEGIEKILEWEETAE